MDTNLLFKIPKVPNKRKVAFADPVKSYKESKKEHDEDQNSQNDLEENTTNEYLSDNHNDLAEIENNSNNDDEDDRFYKSGSFEDENRMKIMKLINEKEKEYEDSYELDLEKLNKEVGINGPSQKWLNLWFTKFEKAIKKNISLRTKYFDQPIKFLQSEATLHEVLKLLSVITENPSIYKAFVEIGGVTLIIEVLAHENSDIVATAIKIISEITDESIEIKENQDDIALFVESFLAAGGAATLADCLWNFNETSSSENDDTKSIDEINSEAVFDILHVFENISNYEKVKDRVFKDTCLPEWLLKRIKEPEEQITQNKQYAVEILSIYVQSTIACHTILEKTNGQCIDELLVFLSTFLKNKSTDENNDNKLDDQEEQEMIENAFDALTALVKIPLGKKMLVKYEGIELLLLMIRTENRFVESALRTLSHASDGHDSFDVVSNIVEVNGLGLLFGLFKKLTKFIIKKDNQLSKKNRIKIESTKKQLHEIIRIQMSLFRSLPENSDEKTRVILKFVENNYEKIYLLINACREPISNQLDEIDKNFAKTNDVKDQESKSIQDIEIFLKKSEAGLFELQTIDILLAWLCVEDDGAKEFIKNLLKQKGENPLEIIKNTLKEYEKEIKPDNLTDEYEILEAKDLSQMIITLVDCI